MKFTKIIALILAIMMVALPLASCAKKFNGTDLEYITDKGKLVIGMTDYKPMNYKDDKGNWIGFDTEFAQLVGEKLGVEVEFVEIDWDSKWEFLEAKDIDCVWNGMTLTDEAKNNASCTDTYVINAQVLVTKAENAEKYADKESLKDVEIAVEVGSAGKGVCAEAELKFKEWPTQADALMAVESGKAEACVIDITMANAMTGEGKAYDTLTTTFSLSEEEYAIACRKDSDLTAKINELMAEFIEDGTLGKLAEKYEVSLVADKK
ncbi:MAG: transporter substrate-binding domain-containing protein [Clostridia bacterium]|nr:transporter substrate-binding domain-containing protein [Clostridia bacterium]